MDFGGLPVEVSWGDAFAEGFQAEPLCLDPAAGMVSGPVLPEGSAVIPCGAQFSLRTHAAGQSSFQGRPLLRIGMIEVACRSIMAVWQRRVP